MPALANNSPCYGKGKVEFRQRRELLITISEVRTTPNMGLAVPCPNETTAIIDAKRTFSERELGEIDSPRLIAIPQAFD
jgi:hypothetical protein